MVSAMYANRLDARPYAALSLHPAIQDDKEPKMASDTEIRTLFPPMQDETPYRKLTGDHVSVSSFEGEEVLKVEPEGLRLLSEQAFADINHFLRPGHLQQLAHILEDPEASPNDRFVAYDMLKNANISAGGVLPMCQDTGTAIICATASSPRSRCSRSATPATTSPPRSRSMPRARTPTSFCSSPRAAARPTRASCSRRRPRC
jgi:hypothetical protein